MALCSVSQVVVLCIPLELTLPIAFESAPSAFYGLFSPEQDEKQTEDLPRRTHLRS